MSPPFIMRIVVTMTLLPDADYPFAGAVAATVECPVVVPTRRGGRGQLSEFAIAQAA
jgi:hypothetical protein